MKSRAVVFLPSAEADIRGAFAYYEACSSGLGSGFCDELDEMVSSLSEHSQLGSVFHADIRRFLLKRFPYGIFYTTEEARIVVHAVLDLRMNPFGIKERFQ